MNIVLWILQILTAFAFVVHARLMFAPDSPQARMMPYIGAIPAPFRQAIGVAEALGGLSLILPALTRILPWLTPVAASGLAIVLAAAIVFHIQRREGQNIVLNLILLVISVVIASRRFILAPL